MVTIDPFMYLSKYVVGFFLVNTTEIGEGMSSSIKGVINKDKVSSSNLYLSCFVLVFLESSFFQIIDDGSHPFNLFFYLQNLLTFCTWLPLYLYT